jgi:hypothetical protein
MEENRDRLRAGGRDDNNSGGKIEPFSRIARVGVSRVVLKRGLFPIAFRLGARNVPAYRGTGSRLTKHLNEVITQSLS